MALQTWNKDCKISLLCDGLASILYYGVAKCNYLVANFMHEALGCAEDPLVISWYHRLKS
jgi:hypothetical protein